MQHLLAVTSVRLRLEAGAVVEDFELPDLGPVIARYSRQGHGWRAAFAVCAAPEGAGDSLDGLAVVHSLEAPTLAQARRAVPLAVTHLLARGPRAC